MAFLQFATFKSDSGDKFPVDMLRYEQAFPKSEEDALKISSTHKRVDQGADFTGTLITVARIALCPNEKWSVDRWQSFGWSLYDKGIKRSG